MTRRTGIIALLAAIGSAIVQGQEPTDTLVWGRQRGPRKLNVRLGTVDGFDPIEVTDGTRTVTLTAKDIMDALTETKEG